MRRIVNILAIWLFVSMFAGCAKTVHTDYDQSIDFTTLKTYALLQSNSSHTGNPTLDNTLTNKRVVFNLQRLLNSSGYQLSPDADFYVDFHWSVKNEQQQASGMNYGVGFGGGNFGMTLSSPRDIETIEKAALTISIYKEKDDKSSLIWQGTSHKKIKRSSSSAKDHDQFVNELLEVILKEFPPK